MAKTVVRPDGMQSTTQETVSKTIPRVAGEARNGTSRSDDEILGLVNAPNENRNWKTPLNDGGDEDPSAADEASGAEKAGSQGAEEEQGGEAEELRKLFEANPELRQAWEDVREYREAFATPQEARNATALLNDVKRMDALFLSGRAEDHAELARSIAALNPEAFASLATAMAAESDRQARHSYTADITTEQIAKETGLKTSRQDRENGRRETLSDKDAFYQSTNAAAVQAVVDAIQTQVERLLPEGASKTTRNRVVGEIFRELDRTLGENRQLEQQVREAMQSNALDASQQRAIVSLIGGRARQALPSVAKKVMDEWTSTILAADRGRRARQRSAEQRVDIVGSGGAARDGHRGTSPRDIDYSRLSDADILNL